MLCGPQAWNWRLIIVRSTQREADMCETMGHRRVLSRTNLIIFLLFLEKSQKCFSSHSPRADRLSLSYRRFFFSVVFLGSTCLFVASRKNHSETLLLRFVCDFFFWAVILSSHLRVRGESRPTRSECEFFCALCSKIGVGMHAHWFQNWVWRLSHTVRAYAILRDLISALAAHKLTWWLFHRKQNCCDRLSGLPFSSMVAVVDVSIRSERGEFSGDELVWWFVDWCIVGEFFILISPFDVVSMLVWPPQKKRRTRTVTFGSNSLCLCHSHLTSQVNHEWVGWWGEKKFKF